MKNAMTMAAAVAALALLAPALFAVEDQEKEEPEIKLQMTCPVMGGKINPKQYADVKDKRIYVCCKGCIKVIEKDPDTYINKLEADGITLDAAGEPQTKCPVMGSKINPKQFTDVKGKRIYVCCRGCIAKIENDPDAILKKLADEGIAPERAPLKTEEAEE